MQFFICYFLIYQQIQFRNHLKKIILSVTNDLVADNRVHKIANSLCKNNNNILLIGRKLKNSQKIKKRNYKCKRMKLFFNKGALFYAEYNFRLFWLLLFTKSDILLSNDLDTLLANFLCAKIKRKKLVYDSHEYFTEVPELLNRKFTKKIWLTIEKFILPKIKYSYTVCNSIADIYNNKYGINMKVIRNIPTCEDKQLLETLKVSDNLQRKIIIYQGAVNIGRGIEYVIKAMQYIDNSIFWIIGDGDIFNNLKKLTRKINVEAKVKFFGKLPFDELKKYTVQADLGISLEENLGLNYYYALPNKLFDYIHAEIPILASQLPEIKRIIEKYKIGTFISEHNEKHIADKIKEIFSQTEQYNNWKSNLKIAHQKLCWKHEENILFELFDIEK